jgi:hypothetical protein
VKPAEEVNTNSNIVSSTYLQTSQIQCKISAVIPIHITNNTENAPLSAKYDCRVKAAYHKNLMGLLEEGMIFAVKNFKSKLDNDGSDLI